MTAPVVTGNWSLFFFFFPGNYHYQFCFQNICNVWFLDSLLFCMGSFQILSSKHIICVLSWFIQRIYRISWLQTQFQMPSSCLHFSMNVSNECLKLNITFFCPLVLSNFRKSTPTPRVSWTAHRSNYSRLSFQPVMPKAESSPHVSLAVVRHAPHFSRHLSS